MQPKKNPKADLNKNRNLYFVIGLTIVTFITWQAIESKTYEKTFDYEALNIEDDDATEDRTTLKDSLYFIRTRISENKDLCFIFKVSDINYLC